VIDIKTPFNTTVNLALTDEFTARQQKVNKLKYMAFFAAQAAKKSNFCDYIIVL